MRRLIVTLAAAGLFTAIAALPARGGPDLFAVVRAGDVERAAALIEAQPARVEARGPRQRTPLHAAAESLRPQMVAMLVQHGAPLDAQDSDGRTALHAAVLARATKRDETTLRAEIVRQLCRAGASRTLADGEGLTPLHLAALRGQADLLELLLSREVDRELKDRAGRTPLHYAALGGHVGVVEFLIARGADVSAHDSAEETPLHLAARRFRADAAVALLRCGAAVDARNSRGQTALILAASQGPSAPEVDAAITGLAERLLDGGAVIDVLDADGRKALDYAREREHKRLVGLLQSRGVHP